EQYLAAHRRDPQPDPPIKSIDGNHDVVVQVDTEENTERGPASEDSSGDVPTEYPTAERGGPDDWAAEDPVRRQEIHGLEAPDDPAFRQGHETESDEPPPSRRERRAARRERKVAGRSRGRAIRSVGEVIVLLVAVGLLARSLLFT